MNNDNTPTPDLTPEITSMLHAERLRKGAALGTLAGLFFSEREATEAEVNEIMRYLPSVMRHKMGLWFAYWSPSDVIEYAEDIQCGFVPTYDQAKGICHDLEGYDHLYSEVNDAVKNELETMRNGGANE